MAPLISTAISVVISLLAMPSILSDAEHRNMFFGISIMLHILIIVVLTVIAYAAARFLDKKMEMMNFLEMKKHLSKATPT